MRVGLAAVLVSAACAVANVATADALPPPDYVERCTLENAKADGDECVMLAHWVFDSRCVKFLADHGFCNRCGMGATNRTEIFCRKPQATVLPADWMQQCLSGADPRKLDPKDLPPPPKVDQCPTERTTSGVVDSSEEPEAKEPTNRKRSGCGCDVATPEPLGAASVVVLVLVALRRTRRAPNDSRL